MNSFKAPRAVASVLCVAGHRSSPNNLRVVSVNAGTGLGLRRVFKAQAKISH
jgi:hypothetical protein